MTCRILISLIILLTLACQNNERQKVKHSNLREVLKDSILIQTTIGIDNISFYDTNNIETFHYKNLDFSIDSGQSVSDATDGAYFQNWITFTNRPTGLSFTFSTPYNTNPALTNNFPKTLKQISIWNNKSAHFDNGIAIGKSTYNDVVNAFGQLPLDWKNKRFIEYPNKGISFSFDSRQVLHGVIVSKITD